MYEMRGPRLAASRAAADCSTTAGPGCRTASPVPGPLTLPPASPDLGLLPDLGSFVAVHEFLQPYELPAQEVSANNLKILFWPPLAWPFGDATSVICNSSQLQLGHIARRIR